MKREKLLTFLLGWIFAALIAWSAVSCLISGFNLTADIPLFSICLFFGALCAACFCWRWGGTVLLCLAAVWAGFLWRGDFAGQQILGLLYQISVIYDRAYGCGVLRFGGQLPVDYPAVILAAVIAVAVARAVCRQKSVVLPMFLAALPLAACLVVTDKVPDEKYLYFLMLGLVTLLFTGSLRKSSPDQIRRLTLMAAPAVAAALALLFWLAPQKSYVNRANEMQAAVLNWIRQVPGTLEQISGDLMSAADGAVEQPEVNLHTVGPQRRLTYPVLEVESSQSGTIYLREQDYDVYSGTGWTSSDRRSEIFAAESEPGGTVIIRTRRSRDSLLIPYYPGEALTLVGGRLNNAEGSKSYTFPATSLPANWHDIATADPQLDTGIYFTVASTNNISRNYRLLPNETKTWAEEFLKTILTDEQSATQKAETIASYVRDSALYDLNTSRMPTGGTDFARWFLEESDTGYCVHFATATAVLLRAAGVDARYVTGYMAGVQAGETATVTAAQAHAWVEYYEPRLGNWILLESTPADLSQEETTAPFQTQNEETTAQTTAEDPVQTTAPAQTEPSTGGEDRNETPAKNRNPGPWLKNLLIPAVLILAAAVQRMLRLMYRSRAMERGTPNARALARWREAERLAKLLGEEPPPALEELAQKAKFSHHTLTKAELGVFDAYLEESRQSLKEKNFFCQILYRWVLVIY